MAEFERISAASKDDDVGMTAEEIAASLGCCRPVALSRIKKLGSRIVVSKRRMTDIAGRNSFTYCYKLRPEA